MLTQKVMMTTPTNSIDDALAALRAGRLVIVVDASDRENEGDFVVLPNRSRLSKSISC